MAVQSLGAHPSPHYFSIILNVTFGNRQIPVILTVTFGKHPLPGDRCG